MRVWVQDLERQGKPRLQALPHAKAAIMPKFGEWLWNLYIDLGSIGIYAKHTFRTRAAVQR